MIILERVSKTYQIGNLLLPVLKDVSLRVEEQEFVTIMGHSGSGKTTLLNILGCLDKSTQGNYLLSGIQISRLNDNELAEIRLKKIGFVFQTFNLLPRLTALKNVELPLLYAGIKERSSVAFSLLEGVGLGERAYHRPAELSGGEQQRVAIARALVNSPSLILADEPTGNLDSTSAKEIMDIFCKLNEEKKMTVVIITHNQAVAERTKRIYHLKDGQIVDEVV
ncbi:ABC transporter ATP-binding protein [bacterium]|nr:ABC transporter ATP-binding protein [bacterium]MBU1752617.1 ABC transporter ATP-binding protein [bacterium]